MKILVILTFILVDVLTYVVSASGLSVKHRSLSDGEEIIYVQYGPIVGKQTWILNHERDGLILREVTDGKRLVQAIYASGKLEDCEVNRRENEATALRREAAQVPTYSNTSSIPMSEYPWMDLDFLSSQCAKRHKQLKKSSRRKRSLLTIRPKRRHHRRNRRIRHDHAAMGRRYHVKQNLIAPGTKWCGPANRARRFNELGGFGETDRCCRKHDTCTMSISPMSNKYSVTNVGPFTLSHCSCDRRKRSLLLPGTSWCGKGYSAKSYRQLGPFARADRCCRRHDLACPYFIGPRSKKYGHFNWRPSTLMHCSCDRRFRTCLKMADTGASNLVGKLFFNLVQTKCFVLKPEKVCTKRTWWGKCQKNEFKKLAHIRSNNPY